MPKVTEAGFITSTSKPSRQPSLRQIQPGWKSHRDITLRGGRKTGLKREDEHINTPHSEQMAVHQETGCRVYLGIRQGLTTEQMLLRYLNPRGFNTEMDHSTVTGYFSCKRSAGNAPRTVGSPTNRQLEANTPIR